MTTPEHTGPIVQNGPTWQRRAFHASVGTAIPVIALFLPDYLPAILAGLLAAASLSLDIARFRLAKLNRFFLRWLHVLLKREESQQVTGATFLLIAACFCFLLFDKPIAVAVLLFLSLGDPVAALVGRPMPGPRILGKSPLGTVAFVGVSLLVLALLSVAGITAFSGVLVVAAIIAGLVELAPIPLDDNLTVPLISGSFAQYFPFLLTLGGVA